MKRSKKASPCGELDGANGSAEKNSYSAAGATASPALRSTKDGPFCWQNKKALKLITEAFAESNQAVSARSVYVALTELASDAQSDTFTVNKALVGFKAGTSVKTVERVLNGLEELGLVKVDRGFVGTGSGTIRAANTYTLLPIRHDDATSLRHGGKPTSKSDRVEESKKNLRTRHGHEEHAHATRASATAAAPSPEGLEELSDDERAIIVDYNTTLVPLGWKRLNRITPAVLEVLRRDSAADADVWRTFFESIANAPRDQWPHHRTFVRLHWDYY